jgi:hypothetical protein
MTQAESSHTCACGGNCSCQTDQQSESSVYLTEAEYIVRLEQYLVELKEEIVAVEAELAKFKQPA